MKEKFHSATILCLTMIVVLMASKRLPADTGTCGGAMTTLPFTDVMGNIFFCPIAEAFISGLTNGTTPTTYSPNDFVPRDQMAAFVTRTQDSALRRGSRRAALNRWWTPQPSRPDLGRINLGGSLEGVQSDGADLWVAVFEGKVLRVRASDGSLLGTWTGAADATTVLVAMGLVFVAGGTNLYYLDPTLAPGAVTLVTNSLGGSAVGIAFDGQRIWTANAAGSVSIVTLGSNPPRRRCR